MHSPRTRLTVLLFAALLNTNCVLLTTNFRPLEGMAPITSVVRIYNPADPDGFTQCSAFAIRLHLFLTAHHCVLNTPDVQMVDGTDVVTAHVLQVDPVNDLAALRAPVERQPIPLGLRPLVGNTVYFIGYGDNGRHPMVFESRIIGEQIPYEGSTLKLLTTGWAVGGMSGGPMLDAYGDYVSIDQMTNGAQTAGAPYDAVRAFVLGLPKTS